MKITISLEDSVSVAGDSVDFSMQIEPALPEKPTEEQMKSFAASRAIQLGNLAAVVIKSVVALSGERANAVPVIERN